MLYKKLGSTGVQIPEIGMGTWRYAGGVEPLRSGLERGACYIDTAESYGSEPVVAEAIKGCRDKVFVATKISPIHYRRAAVLEAADRSLRNLRTDYIDLYQLHFPEPKVPMEETLQALEDLVDAGKVRFIGVSNFSVAELERASRALRKHPLVSNQVRYNLIDRTIEQGLLDFCQAHGITVIAYSPLARIFQRILDCDPAGVLSRVARETGRTTAQVALNWCLCRPGVVAIPKGSTVAHAIENCGASDWQLTPEQIQALNEKITFRHRGTLEAFLRNHIPGPLQEMLKALVRVSPRFLRRRLS